MVNQFIETFDAPHDPTFRAALRFSPLLLMQPVRRSGGFVEDPRVLGALLVAGIVLLGEDVRRR